MHTAAYWADSGYRELDAPTLDAHYAVNVRGAILLSVAFARRWPGGLGGRIISITSGQSQGPMPGELVFIATERVNAAFSPSLSTAPAPLGIRVNAVDLGAIDTGWMGEDLRRELLAQLP